jgi:hypothetical protein
MPRYQTGTGNHKIYSLEENETKRIYSSGWRPYNIYETTKLI